VKKVLTDYQRAKQDSNDDTQFYITPRFVHHLDIGFRTRLTHLYTEYISPNSVVLDLMSSWVSHYPIDLKLKEVIGHGLNKEELNSNRQLSRYWVQNLNNSQILPLQENTIDFCTIVAGWQYLQEPEALSCEIRRVIKPKGSLIVSFSDRAFWTKSPRIWIESTNYSRLMYISSVLVNQGWLVNKTISEKTYVKGLMNLYQKEGDPFFSVIATNPS
tara:strand:- start:143 stop:790 length:648 start_codon:yes stop_codon:yes gene_type:complete